MRLRLTTKFIMTSISTVEDSPEIIERFLATLPLADVVARKMHRKLPFDAELEDLKSEAQATLLQAARSFDASRGIPFEKYAALHMRWGVLAAAKAESGVPKKQQRLTYVIKTAIAVGGLSHAALDIASLHGQDLGPAEAEAALDDLLSSYATAAALQLINRRQITEFDESTAAPMASQPDPEDLAQQGQASELLRQGLKSLDERELTVITAIFFEGRSMSDLAEEMHCDRSWVCRIQAKAVAKMRRVFQHHGVWNDPTR